LSEAAYSAPSSISDVLKIDREVRTRVESKMKARCS